MNWWKLMCFMSWLPAWQIFSLFDCAIFSSHHSLTSFLTISWTFPPLFFHSRHLNCKTLKPFKLPQNRMKSKPVSAGDCCFSLPQTFTPLPDCTFSTPFLTFLWDEKKSRAHAHLHAQRLGSSCERGIEMEIGGERKSRLRFANVCAAS